MNHESSSLKQRISVDPDLGHLLWLVCCPLLALLPRSDCSIFAHVPTKSTKSSCATLQKPGVLPPRNALRTVGTGHEWHLHHSEGSPTRQQSHPSLVEQQSYPLSSRIAGKAWFQVCTRFTRRTGFTLSQYLSLHSAAEDLHSSKSSLRGIDVLHKPGHIGGTHPYISCIIFAYIYKHGWSFGTHLAAKQAQRWVSPTESRADTARHVSLTSLHSVLAWALLRPLGSLHHMQDHPTPRLHPGAILV